MTKELCSTCLTKETVAKGLCNPCYQKQWKAADHLAGKRWREKNKDYLANRELIRAYNITLDKYNELLNAQGGVCFICKEPPQGKRLAVDHDHDCCPALWGGKRTKRNISCGECIRGLLCDSCNQGLGKFKDDATRLRNALQYLEGYNYVWA